MPAKIVYHLYGIEVFTASGGFAGGITMLRLAQGTESIAVALRCILDGCGIEAELQPLEAVERTEQPR